MTSGRIWALVAAQAAGHDGPVSAEDVCVVAVTAVDVAGAWLVVTAAAHAAHVILVTDPVGENLAELEQTFGEGPALDVVTSGGPVLAADLGTALAASRWPAFAPAACGAGALAVFAFPLRIGAIKVGVLGLYRDRPGPLSPAQLGDALVLADTATMLLLEPQRSAGGGVAARAGPGGQPANLAEHRAEIDQATGMLTEQLGTSVDRALLRLRAYAYAQDRRIGDVARDIVARRLRLRPDPDLSGDDEGW